MYRPGTPPATIARIQDALQRLQKSPEGWRVAQHLLDLPKDSLNDTEIKFFGVLTIIIKLNTER